MRDAETPVRDAATAHRGADPDGPRRGRRRDGRGRCATPARPRSRRRGRPMSVRPEYEVWISDGEIVRTYASAHGLGTQRPVRNRPRGLDDPDFPGTSKVYEPVTALPDGDPARHVRPPGRLLPERARDRALPGHRHGHRRRPRGDHCSSATTRARPSSPATGRTSTSRSRSIATPGSSCDSSRSIGGERHPPRRGHRAPAGRPAPALGLRLRLPHRDDDALLSRGSSEACRAARISPATNPSPAPFGKEGRADRSRSAADGGARGRSTAATRRPTRPRSIPAFARGAPPRRGRSAPAQDRTPTHRRRAIRFE